MKYSENYDMQVMKIIKEASKSWPTFSTLLLSLQSLSQVCSIFRLCYAIYWCFWKFYPRLNMQIFILFRALLSSQDSLDTHFVVIYSSKLSQCFSMRLNMHDFNRTFMDIFGSVKKMWSFVLRKMLLSHSIHLYNAIFLHSTF
ncbi:hypothetical protein EGR_09793 [Echinococcus granulosus]|uniref:Uncharacterized protein n=1 Tax=Echinococcus granulosus TaxID=6210 RepID=W6U426_ECHGR|nr:hypothetical protein EGR_09793 [Echinococcus granulosus]EUB55356.1 hypothetical protein EGR_09793 [Echinococcus granulosus]